MKIKDILFNFFFTSLLLPKLIILKDKEEERHFTILKSDNDFSKPIIKLNAEFEMIKMENGMKGLLINDPYSTISHVHFEVEYGCFIDTISSISHLAEHMILQGSKNYNISYPILRTIGGIKLYSGGAITGQTDQEYFYTIPYSFKFDEALKVFVNAFIHPLYSEEIIKKEIQTLNSEFYFNINEENHLLDAIIRLLSSNKTSFYGFTSGNNNTLNPNDNKNLSKKLKSYHNIANRPENIFFIIYSNLTINEMEKYSEKHLNYKMFEFPENVIDISEKEKLLKNIENFKYNEIFDENIYEHGIYYNSHSQKNLMNIFFYVGKVDFKDLQFDLFEYYSYLLNSESLLNILKEKNYISSIHNFEVIGAILIPHNNVFSINLELSEKGLNNAKEVLLIIYKYIKIMKNKGYKKIYFDDFIKFRQNKNNKDFQKEMFNILTTFTDMIESYRTYGINQIFKYGTPSSDNYNKSKLKDLLNAIKLEKSFFIINTIEKASKINTFLENPEIKKLKFYNVNYLYGKFPKSLKNEVFNENLNIDNLFMRKINPYFSEKNEKVIPCYKQKINKCKEINEFDYESEERYKGTLLEKDNYYITYYQIDKSSESFFVNLYLDLNFVENESITNEFIEIMKFYINDRLSEINEVPSISIDKFDQQSIAFKIISFTDNIQNIFNDFIRYLMQEPIEMLFNYSKISNKAKEIEKAHLSFRDYIFAIGNKFLSGGLDSKPKLDDILENINNINFEYFKNLYNYVFNKIKIINLKIAGNINRNLVQILHNNLKENFKIFSKEDNIETCDDNSDLKENNSDNNEDNKNSNYSKESNDLISSKKDFSFIVDYYQKSTMPNELDGGIFILYKYEEKFNQYMEILKGCLESISKIYLRFELFHAYHPHIYVEKNFFMIFEQGRHKEVTQMEDEINEILLGMINGKIKCDNYKDIIKSYRIKTENINEKNPENLFKEFISEGNNNENENGINYTKIKFPKKFGKFMKKLSPIFINPKRYTILISRYDISDNEFNLMFKKRKETAKYILNENIRIIYTDNIEFLKPRN